MWKAEVAGYGDNNFDLVKYFWILKLFYEDFTNSKSKNNDVFFF